MKKFAKRCIVIVLGWQVRRLYKKHHPYTIGVAGSIGKTSTKLAIATILKQKYRVQFQRGNYNDAVTVPLVFFGHNMPGLLNPLAWLWLFVKNEALLHGRYPYDVVVVELGTDGPGQIAAFGKYLHLDIAVLTAITPEHMEFFHTLDAVAQEEVAIADFSDRLLANKDLCNEGYLKNLSVPLLTYAIRESADYQVTDLAYDNQAFTFTVQQQGKPTLSINHESIAEVQLYTLCAAIVIAYDKGLSPTQITHGLRAIQPASGRMRPLVGQKDSLILDDTYNSSPEAARAALDTLYRLKAPQKIAILGTMNELGSHSKDAHRELGAACNPKQLDLVVTIGPEANRYLATAAKKQGCQVKTFNDPYAAGKFVHTALRKGAIVLAKGSQNGVFAEEAIKQFLANPDDNVQLVRQTPAWLAKKAKAFGGAQ